MIRHVAALILLFICTRDVLANGNWCTSTGVNGPFIFEWKTIEKGEPQDGILEIKSRSSNQVIQVITGRYSHGEWKPDFTDYNFDGCPDLSWIEYATQWDYTRAVFLFDKVKNQFVFSDVLSDLSNLQIHNNKKKCLSSDAHGGLWAGGSEIYCWEKNRLILMEKSKFWWNDEKGCVERREYRRIHSRLKKTSTSCKTPD